jgi:hypothetical protein
METTKAKLSRCQFQLSHLCGLRVHRCASFLLSHYQACKRSRDQLGKVLSCVLAKRSPISPRGWIFCHPGACASANTESISSRKHAIEDVADVMPPAKRTKTAKEEKLEKKLKLRAKRSIKAKHAQDMSLVTLKNADKRKVTGQRYHLELRPP